MRNEKAIHLKDNVDSVSLSSAKANMVAYGVPTK